MTALMPRGVRWLEVGAVLALFLVIQVSANETDLATSADCYYNYNHYSEGDRILTNEPCLNCTCHNKMLMCYLKVCPFTKPIGQDCTIEKREDQCCPIITCPEVPVELDHSSAQSTDLAMHQNHGCSIDDLFYPEGAQIPGNPKKPCELCYCIRNMTSCVMQECTLHVDGCRPIYNKGVCCPVRYDCAHDEEIPLMLEDQTTTTEAPSQGFIITTTMAPAQSTDCYHNSERYTDGESIDTEHPCEHCYCMRGDIVCAVQECKPLEMHGKNCTAALPSPGECCPQVYECESDMPSTTLFDDSMVATTLGYRGDDSVLATTKGAPISDEYLEKESLTTEASIGDTTSQRIDESENEIHDKDYHDQMTAKPTRTNFTEPQVPSAADIDDSTTILSKLDDVTATTILSESGPISDEQLTTILPMVGLPQIAERESTESEGILSNLYTTIKQMVDFTTTSSPLLEQPQQKPQVEDDSFLSNVIPGEGDCLDNGITYSNNTNVPTRNACEESCLCHNSIVQCEQVKCAPMPPNAENCRIHQEEGLCCPSYHCESMEFSTGTPPTHPAESQVIHRDDEHVDSTTLTQPSDVEQKTNAVDSELDSTTIPSAKQPISSKLDDALEVKPEATSEAKLEQETAAPEMESSTPTKIQEEMPIEEQQQPQQTEQPIKEEIATEAATVKSEPEVTTQAETVDRIQSEGERTTTSKISDDVPQEAATTQLPMRDDAEPEQVTEVAGEKLHDEIQPTTQATAELTTQRASEEMATTPKTQQEDEISTEQQQPAVQPEEQKPEEIVTTEGSLADKAQQQDEIVTEQQPIEQPIEQPAEQPEVEKQEELATTAQPTIEKEEQPQEEISTEQQPIEEPEGQKQPELITTEAPIVDKIQPQEEDLTTEQQPAKQADEMKPEELVTTEAPLDEAQPQEEIVTEQQPIEQPVDQPAEQPEVEKQEELATTAQPTIEKEQQPQEEVSTEKQLEMDKLDEIATTQGPSEQKEEVQKEITTESLPKQDEYVTTEKLEAAPEQPSATEQQPIVPAIEEATTVKLAEEPIEAVTSRVSESEAPVKPAPSVEEPLSSSTEKQLEEEYIEKATENLIPDSSTEQQKEPEEISTEKQMEPIEQVEDKQITTEKVIQSEQEVTEQSLPQTTVASESKPSDEMQQTTIEPKPIVQEPIATEKQPEYIENEIASELPIEDHHTEKEIIAPTTEAQASASPETVTERQGSTETVELATTEQAAVEEQTTITSKLNVGNVSPTDFKDGEVISQDEKLELDVTTELMQQVPEVSSTEAEKQQPIVTEQPTEKAEEKITEAPAVSEEKEQVTTEKQLSEATTMYVFPSKQEDLEIITEKIAPTKEEEMELTTVRQEEPIQEEAATTLSSKPEMQDEQVTESKVELKPSTPSLEAESTTPGKVAEEEQPYPAIVEEMPRETTAAPLADEKQPATPSFEQSEQTTFGAMVDQQPTEATEVKEEEPIPPIPTTQQPLKPELQSDNQMHIDDEQQPEVPQPAVTTEVSKQEEPAIPTTTASVVPSDTDDRLGEEQMRETTVKSVEQQPIVTESAVTSSESPKEEQPSVTTEQNIVDITTILNKIQDEVTTQKQIEEQPQEPQQQTEQPQQQTEQPQQQTEQPQQQTEQPQQQTEQPQQQTEQPQKQTEQPQQQTEQPQQQTEQPQQQTEEPQQQTEQPQQPSEQTESTSAPVKQSDEKPELETFEETVTTEQAAIPMEKESSTQGAQEPSEIDSTTAAAAAEEPIKQDDKIQEIPSESTTLQPQGEEMTQRIESSSVPAMVELAQTTLAPSMEELTTQYEMEKATESQAPELVVKDAVEATTQKETPIESSTSEREQAPMVPESTEREEDAAVPTTGAPTKLEEPAIISQDELPAEPVTTERVESAPIEDQSSTTKPSIFDLTTIKSVVELLTTLYPREPAVEQQEAEVTTASQPHVVDDRIETESSSMPAQQESYTTESVPKESSEEPAQQQTFAPPPESSNKIPLIREPSHDEITTKLAESFDTTTLPSILLTSSHTERISDSTTIKNTQNEIMETTAQPQQQSQTESSIPVDAAPHETDAQPPFAQPGFDSGYGNVPSQYPDEEYGDEEEPAMFGPGTCRYGGKLYVSAQQIPRDDPCDFCFCFRSDIICLQQSCPPPINGCHEEPIQGFCCPRYECPVSMGLVLNSTTTTTTTLPPYLSHFQRNTGKLTRSGCQIQGQTYKIGERVTTASGPCIDCICGGDGQMKCDPKVCTPEPMLRQMIASAKRR